MPTPQEIRDGIASRSDLSAGKNTLAIGGAITRMGLKGGILPKLPESTWGQVVVMGQLNNLTSEPFEGRAVSGAFQDNVPAGRHASFEIFSIGGGGLVLESLDFIANPPGEIRVAVSTLPAVFGQIGVVELAKMEVGGIPTRSLVSTVNRTTVPAGGVRLGSSLGGISLQVALNRLLVPAGSFLSVIHTLFAADLTVTMLWRELEDVGGSA